MLNVVLARPIFSPTDFIQIKGRGTRLFTFTHGKLSAKKDGFAFFDFFANCEYFEKDFNYDTKLSLPPGGEQEGPGGGGGGENPPPQTFTNASPDPMSAVVQESIGLWGMKIDPEMYRSRLGERLMTDAELREAMERGDASAAIGRLRRFHYDKPEEYWNLEKLQDLSKTDRVPTEREILEFVFGIIPAIPGRAQLADEAFERFVATPPARAVHSHELKVVFVAFLLDEASRFLLQEGKFAELRARDASLYGSLSQLEPQEREALIGYLQSEMPLKEFEQVA